MAQGRRAGFIAVGSELLRSGRLDTNSLVAARLLRRCGYALVEKRCLVDDRDEVAHAIGQLLERVELVLVSGGLGPTADDITREAVADALGLSLVRDPEIEAALEARFTRLGRVMPEIGRRMADVLLGAEVLPNPHGTAPGQLLEVRGRQLLLLPGVPSEFEAIMLQHVVPRWGEAAGVSARTLRLAGVYESQVEDRVAPLYERFGRDNVTILASRGRVDLLLQAQGPKAEAELAEMESAFAATAGADLFGRDDETLAFVIVEQLRRKGWTLATAESCTGGLVGAELTAVSGASDVFVGGVVAYSNELKSSLLGVPASLLAAHGAVSEQTARAMAQGALTLGATCGLAITGIAGPSGGSPEKPVGTVHIAAVTPSGMRHAGYRFPGDRAMVRELAANFALDLLRRAVGEGP